MPTYQLNATKRELKEKNRSALQIPAVVYGRGFANININLALNEFEKIYKTAGTSSIIELKVNDNEPIIALIQDIQYHPLKNRSIHVDFKQIRMDEKVTAFVTLNFIGESPVVKLYGGVLAKIKEEIEIKCLPKDLIHQIDIDISRLKTFDDIIRISDLNLSNTVEVLDDSNEVLVKVEEMREEEVKQVVAAEVVAPEVAEKGKVAKEGEAAEPAAEAKK